MLLGPPRAFRLHLDCNSQKPLHPPASDAISRDPPCPRCTFESSLVILLTRGFAAGALECAERDPGCQAWPLVKASCRQAPTSRALKEPSMARLVIFFNKLNSYSILKMKILSFKSEYLAGAYQ